MSWTSGWKTVRTKDIQRPVFQSKVLETASDSQAWLHMLPPPAHRALEIMVPVQQLVAKFMKPMRGEARRNRKIVKMAVCSITNTFSLSELEEDTVEASKQVTLSSLPPLFACSAAWGGFGHQIFLQKLYYSELTEAGSDDCVQYDMYCNNVHFNV